MLQHVSDDKNIGYSQFVWCQGALTFESIAAFTCIRFCSCVYFLPPWANSFQG